MISHACATSCALLLLSAPPVPRRAVCAGCSAAQPPDFATRDISAGRPLIEWYPGHIAKAERVMSEVLSMVDVVVELRDARIPASTAHPLLRTWVGSRGHVLALNRMDAAPDAALSEWSSALTEQAGESGPVPLAVDARQGKGVAELKRAILAAGRYVNERRARRGINSRPVRAAILGYPNVGKSALINRLVGRKKAKSENRPGVTRGFCWVRIDRDVQLLDSPGIIPAKQVSQAAAYHLAMCDDIGNAAYDTRSVSAALLETLVGVGGRRPAYVSLAALEKRLLPPAPGECGEEYLERLAEAKFTGDVQRAATVLLKEFRSGAFGRVCLEFPGDEQ